MECSQDFNTPEFIKYSYNNTNPSTETQSLKQKMYGIERSSK